MQNIADMLVTAMHATSPEPDSPEVRRSSLRSRRDSEVLPADASSGLLCRATPNSRLPSGWCPSASASAFDANSLSAAVQQRHYVHDPYSVPSPW